MDDTFSLDLDQFDKDYIFEVLGTFLDRAHRYGRKVVEIRMSAAMLGRLEIGLNQSSFRGVPIAVSDAGFEGTIEVALAPQR